MAPGRPRSRSPRNGKLTFGKHKGKKLEDVSDDYLMSLCSYKITVGERGGLGFEDLRGESFADFLWSRHPQLVEKAREEAIKRGLWSTCSARLTFGQHKDSLVNSVPNDYLKYLCCYHISVNREGKVKLGDFKDGGSRKWLWQWKPLVIAAARQEVQKRTLCCYCFRSLVHIGFSRANGRDHRDWLPKRSLHKKCWVELLPGEGDLSSDGEDEE